MSSWCSPMPALVTYRIEAEGSPTTRQASPDNRNLPSCLMSPALHMSRESPHIPSNQIRVKVAEQTPRLISSKPSSSTSEPLSKRTATKTADQEDASVLAPIRRLHADILAEIFPQRIRWIWCSYVGPGPPSFWKCHAGSWTLPLNWEQTRAALLDVDINPCTGVLKVVNGDESMRNVCLMMIAKEVKSWRKGC